MERLDGVGDAAEVMKAEPDPFLATVGPRVEPGPLGSGVVFRLGVELGSMPSALFVAVEETLRQRLRGRQVLDCTVTMTRSGYAPRQGHAHAAFDRSTSSTARDFRHLTPLVVTSALGRAGRTVHEPVHRFHLEVPADTCGTVLPALSRFRAVPHPPVGAARTCCWTASSPPPPCTGPEQLLPALTRGEGVLGHGFDHYEAVTGQAPERPRTDDDPLHREEYLLRAERRVRTRP